MCWRGGDVSIVNRCHLIDPQLLRAHRRLRRGGGAGMLRWGPGEACRRGEDVNRGICSSSNGFTSKEKLLLFLFLIAAITAGLIMHLNNLEAPMFSIFNFGNRLDRVGYKILGNKMCFGRVFLCFSSQSPSVSYNICL